MTTHEGFDGKVRTVHQTTIYGTVVDYVNYDGQKVRVTNLDSILAAAYYTDGWGAVTIVQGGLSAGSKSASTHLYLDATDISVRGHTKEQVWEFCDNLFETGNLPFPRGFVRDSFQGPTVKNIHDGNEHIHNLYAPASFGHPTLRGQYQEWSRERGDGLRGSAHYTGPVNERITKWRDSMFNPANRKDGNWTLYVNVDAESTLLGLDRDRRVKVERKRGDKLELIAQVYRWGRTNYLTRFGTFYAADYLTPNPAN